MRMRNLALLVGLLCACSSPDLTLRIDTELRIPEEIDRLALTVTGEREPATSSYALEADRPLEIGLDFAQRPALLLVEAELSKLSATASLVVTASAQTELTSQTDCLVMTVPKPGSGRIAQLFPCSSAKPDAGPVQDLGPDLGQPSDLGPIPDVGALDMGSADTGIADMGAPDMGVTNFSFTPSNISLGGLTFGGDWVIDGACAFDSTQGLFSGSCGAPPTPQVQSQTGNSMQISVLAVRSFELRPGARLTLTGIHAVALAVRGDARIEGIIDVSASETSPGAGQDPGCAQRAGSAPTQLSSPSGGGGAGHGTNGGLGGDYVVMMGGLGGFASASPILVPLSSGCSGGPGGTRDTMFQAQGGFGGGALQLSAAGAILIDAAAGIFANGGGGQGGPGDQFNAAAGAGGGSGGAVLLESDLLVIDGRVTASGGGGGGGSENEFSGENGDPGQSDGTAAAGGQGARDVTARGGNGGDGATFGNGAPGQEAPGATSTAGGGGGGAGALYFNASSCITGANAVLVPAPVLGPGC